MASELRELCSYLLSGNYIQFLTDNIRYHLVESKSARLPTISVAKYLRFRKGVLDNSLK